MPMPKQPLTPWQRYQNMLKNPDFIPDSQQANVVKQLQNTYEALLKNPTKTDWWTRLWHKPPTTITGIYIWGGVGRGKTYLMDSFYDSLPFKEKKRLHFHHFMHDIQYQLNQQKHHQDPLKNIAANIAKTTRLLCLDEFIVEDIGEAMILSTLLAALFDQGLTLITTSNSAPDNLYKAGLQRTRFLPAIHRLKQTMHILALNGDTDYRLHKLSQAPVYYYPLNAQADKMLQAAFLRFVPTGGQQGYNLILNERNIPTVCHAENVVWLDFQVICNIPRAVDDYIALARLYKTILLSRIPVMDGEQDDFVHRLIELVDEFYDRKVKLIISAEALPAQLYQGKKLAFAFQRTISRLQEMGSEQYLGETAYKS